MAYDLTNLLEELNDGLYLVNQKRTITYWNKAAEKITGFDSTDVTGSRCMDNILIHVDKSGKTLCDDSCPLTQTIEDGKSRQEQLYMHHKNGHRIPVNVRVSPLRDESGKIVGGAELFSDISRQDILEKRVMELEKLAFIDELTRISNRRHVEAELEMRLEEKARYGLNFGFIFMDIDKFKVFNDTYGHATGDEILKTIASTMKVNSRVFDVFGRWGGEEFAGIIRNIDSEHLIKIADRIRILIRNTSISIHEKPTGITVSMGVTMARNNDNPEKIVTRADRLMYRSKTMGRDRLTTDCNS